MHNIAFIPIDNRPVCYQLALDIAQIDKNINLFIPDKSLLGDLTKPAQIDKIIDWIFNLKNIDSMVISLDTIAYGGLIPSRRTNDSIDDIKNRINKLKNIILKNKIKTFAFSSIMRISNNNINEEEKEYWNLYGEKIFQYSYRLHEINKDLNFDTYNIELQNEYEIPQDILKDYLNTRNRNFEINKYYLDLANEGIFETLIFSKDDCSEYGLNVKEANNLKNMQAQNVFVKTGADEIPLSLLSRAINSCKKIKIAPLYLEPNSTDKISKYEDISVEESVKSQIELAGAIYSDLNNCDMILVVNNFKDEQGELVMNIDVPLFQGKFPEINKPFCIADIRNANGSDNNFVNKWFNKFDMYNFYGYAGWNTTGNTLGSVLSAAMTLYNAKIPNYTAFKLLELKRFLDDWAYQANVRALIRNDLNNLSNGIIKEKMLPFEEIIFDKLKISDTKLSYSFPWNRFFEIEIEDFLNKF